jgi:transcriptional regulator with XRE-family HTH domain
MKTPLSADQVRSGQRLGRALAEARRARGDRIADVAANSGLAVDTVKRIESATALAPTFFTVAAIARVLELSLDELARIARGRGR